MLNNLIYTQDRFNPERRNSLQVKIGDLVIGGGSPIAVQSMTTTNTRDIKATAAQSIELAKAGCELIRITAPTVTDAQCLEEIVKIVRSEGINAPFCADIHFQPKAAMESLKWVEKVRINPGNFVDTKSANIKEYDDIAFDRGVQKVFDSFSPLVKEAKKNGVCLRIGTNHGSLSDRILFRYGDTANGMVESALEFLRVCESESFTQIVFSMKSSNPKVVIQAYRLLAARLFQDHKNYPFHIGVTEAGDGQDGRFKSAVGIGALLMDGLGDTIRVSLTEDPVKEIPVAIEIIKQCDMIHQKLTGVPTINESLDFYNFSKRECRPVTVQNIGFGGEERIKVGTEISGTFDNSIRKRKLEWATAPSFSTDLGFPVFSGSAQPLNPSEASCVTLDSIQVKGMTLSKGSTMEVVLAGVDELENFSLESFDGNVFWSVKPSLNMVQQYRYLAAWLSEKGRKDPIVLRAHTSGTLAENIRISAMLGSLLSDGIGDCIHIVDERGEIPSVDLAYDILQAASVRRSKTEYVSCPSCGRTLFDLETTTDKIRKVTSHLADVSIAIMGCIVNGPGEMADADFGYVGGAPGKVSLYVSKDCVQMNIPEEEAPEALVGLIKDHGRWRDPGIPKTRT